MTQSRVPHINLETFWPYQVVLLADIISRNTRNILQQHTELNLSQWRVLAAIAEKPGRTAVEVVAITPMDKGIVSRAVSALIEAGLSEKLQDKNDRRRSILQLTEKGLQNYTVVAMALENSIKPIPENIPGSEAFSELLKSYISKMTPQHEV